MKNPNYSLTLWDNTNVASDSLGRDAILKNKIVRIILHKSSKVK